MQNEVQVMVWWHSYLQRTGGWMGGGGLGLREVTVVPGGEIPLLQSSGSVQSGTEGCQGGEQTLELM